MSIWAKIYNTYNFIRSQNDEDITKFIVNNINYTTVEALCK